MKKYSKEEIEKYTAEIYEIVQKFLGHYTRIINGTGQRKCGKYFPKNDKRYLKEFILNQTSALPENTQLKERIYCILHDLQDIPKCYNPNCNNYVPFLRFTDGYQKYCSIKCAESDIEIKTKKIKTSLEHFGVEYPFQHKVIKEKITESILNNYGVTNYTKTNECQAKRKATCLKKYGVDAAMKCDKVKKTLAEVNLKKYGSISPFGNKDVIAKSKKSLINHYGTDCYFKSDEYKKNEPQYIKLRKISEYETRRKNGTFTTSKPEEEIYEKLCVKFGKENIIRQYKTELYPYCCDFYISSIDTYIEYQGTWTHGFKPFTEDDIVCQQQLEKWKSKKTKYYENAIYVWTNLDVRKRTTAKQNKLNYLEFFNMQQFEEWLKTQ